MLFLAKWSKQTKKSLIELRDSVSEKKWNNLSVTMRSIFTNSSLKERPSMNEIVEYVLAEDQLSALTMLDIALRNLEQTEYPREIIHKLGVAYFLN